MSNTNIQNDWSAETNIFYDNDLSAIYFEEKINRINNNLHMYMRTTDFNELSELPELEDLIHIHRNSSKKNLISAIDGNYSHYYNSYEDFTRDNLIDEMYDNYSIEQLDDFLEVLKGSNVKYKLKYTKYITRGYSQGDYAEVLILNDIIEKVSQQYIDNLFWDSPISGTITFEANNKTVEFYVSDISNSTYWNDLYDMNDFEDDLRTFLENRYKYVAAKDKIISMCLESLPSEI